MNGKPSDSDTQAGAPSERAETLAIDHLPADAQASIRMLVRENDALRQDMAKAERRLAELRGEARQDLLTGLLNRRGIEEELTRAIDLVRRYDAEISMLFVDVDDLKKINDAHGHAVGDMALMHVAGLLASHVRRSDFVARIGGDEFALLLWNTDQQLAETKAKGLGAVMAHKPLVADGETISLSASIGAAEIRPEDDDPRAVVARADKAMYGAKQRKSPVDDGAPADDN